MCDTPDGRNLGSPEIFRDIRCNLDNKFIESRDSIKSNDNLAVFARVRPILPQETAKGYEVCVAAVDEQTVRVIVPTKSAKFKSSRQNEEIIEEYTFTAAFGPETGQFVFFQETMLNIMSNFVEGSNSLIFSYGITGSGKTYTLQGNAENPGIIPLSLKLYFAVTERQLMKNILLKPHMYSDVVQLSEMEKEKELSKKERLLSSYDDECEAAPGSFRNNNEKSFAMTLCNLFSDDFEAEERQTTLCAEDMASAQAATLLKEVIKKIADNQPGVCCVWVSFIEIYNETIFDLLQPVSNLRPKLNLGEDKSGNVYIKGVTEICIFNSDEALKILNIGRKHLSIASTKMNYQSSRSHCIYTIRVVRVPDVNNMTQARVSRLSFCDLAGSERTSKTQTTGVRLKEASSINTSLLVLGRCLEHLRLSQMARDKRMIPFRESKLTRIFSGFFLGQGRAAMIANASPSDYTFDETLHVLKFSAVARKLLIEDTFLSNASSTIQSICNQWEIHKANVSTNNESMESVESDDELIREKDELFEKLLNLAKNFAEKEKEMNEMEMRIRREVCEEYAEVREDILAMNKLRYEEEIATIKAAYEKRIASMESRYQNDLKKLHDQLTDTDESILEDQSFEYASPDTSLRLSLSKSDSSQLKKDLEEKTTELESVKIEVLNKQIELNDLRRMQDELTLKISDMTSYNENLKKEYASEAQQNDILKSKVESLQREIEELKTIQASDEEKIKHFEIKVENLLTQLETDAKKNIALKEQMEATFEAQKQKENRILIDKINSLEKQIDALKADKSSCDKDIKIIQEKLSESQIEKIKSEEIIHDQSETISSLENETAILRKGVEMLEKIVAELKESKNVLKMEFDKEKSRHKKEISEAKIALRDFTNFKILSQSDMEQKNAKIANLEQELHSASKNYDTLQKEKQLREKVSMELEKEIDALKQTIDKMQKEIEESVSSKSKLESKISVLNDELKRSQENSQQLSSTLEDIENKNVAYKLEIQKLSKNRESLNNSQRVITLEKELSFLQNEKLTFQEKNKNITEKLVKLEDIEQKLEIEEDKCKKLEEECIRLKELNENIKSEKVNVEKELYSTKDNMEKICRNHLENLEKKEKECVTLIEKHEIDLKKWKQEKLSVDAEKKELEEKFNIATDYIKSLEKKIQEKSSKILELEDGNKKRNMNDENLKQEELLAQKKEFEEKLTCATNKMKLMEQNLQEKASKISEFENLIEKHQEDLKKWKQEKLSVDAEKKELEEKFTAATDNIKSLKTEIEEKISKILEFENQINMNKIEVANLQDEHEQLESENLELKSEIDSYKKTITNLEEMLTSAVRNLTQEENQNSVGIETKMKICMCEMENFEKLCQCMRKEKDRLLMTISEKTKSIEDIEAQLCSVKDCLETVKKELNDKNIEVQDLKNDLALSNKQLEENKKTLETRDFEFSSLKKEYEQLRNKMKIISSEKDDLQRNVNSERQNLAQLKKEIEEKDFEMKSIAKKLEKCELDFNILEEQNEKLSLKIKDLESVNKNLNKKNTENENLAQLKKEMEEKDLEVKSIAKKLKKGELDYNVLKEKNEELSIKIADLEAIKKNLDNKIAENENLDQLKKEMEEKEKELESIANKLKKSELEINVLKEKNEKMSLNIKDLESVKKKLDKKIAENENLAQLKKELDEKDSEVKSLVKKLKKSELDINVLKEKNEKLSIKIQDLEAVKKSFDKRITEIENISKEELKKSKDSFENKILMEKEQHTIEIEQTMKLKRDVEKENEKLKQDNIKFKENIELLEEELKSFEQKNQPEKSKKVSHSKAVNKIGTKETGSKSKITKTSTARTTRLKKEIKCVDLSFSDDETVNLDSDDNSKKNRKRTSDEDFDGAIERASKRKKPNEASSSKIPLVRASRRKQLSDPVENLSPVQKIANSISTRFKAVAETVSSKIGSPRQTRGRKKLYDPDSKAPYKSEKVTRGKK